MSKISNITSSLSTSSFENKNISNPSLFEKVKERVKKFLLSKK